MARYQMLKHAKQSNWPKAKCLASILQKNSSMSLAFGPVSLSCPLVCNQWWKPGSHGVSFSCCSRKPWQSLILLLILELYTSQSTHAQWMIQMPVDHTPCMRGTCMEARQLNKLHVAQSKNCLQYAWCSCSVAPKLVHAQVKWATDK